MRHGYLTPDPKAVETQIEALQGKSSEELAKMHDEGYRIVNTALSEMGIESKMDNVKAVGGPSNEDKAENLNKVIVQRTATGRILAEREEIEAAKAENEAAKQAVEEFRRGPRVMTPDQVAAELAKQRAQNVPSVQSPFPETDKLRRGILSFFSGGAIGGAIGGETGSASGGASGGASGSETGTGAGTEGGFTSDALPTGFDFLNRFSSPFAFKTAASLRQLIREPVNAIAEDDTMRPGSGDLQAQANIGMLRFPPLADDIEYYQRRQTSVYAFLAPRARTIPIGGGGAYRYTAETAPSEQKPAPRKAGTALARRKYATEIRTSNIESMGAWVPVAREEFLDVQGFAQFVNTVLRDDVLLAVDEQLLTGDGTAPNIRGLNNISGIQTNDMAPASGVTEYGVTEIHRAMTDVFNTGFSMVDFMVMNPVDWHNIRTHRDGEKRLQMGSELLNIAPMLFDVNIIRTPAQVAGTVFLGSSMKLQMLEQGGVVIEWTNSHDDGFANVTDAVRGVCRVGLVSRRDVAQGKVTSFAAEKTGA